MSEADRFWKIFQREWTNQFELKSREIRACYDDAACWTDFMLSNKGDGGFLDRVGERYLTEKRTAISSEASFSLQKEWYTVDLMGILHSDPDDYTKSDVHFVLEHENAQDVETEMWKLVLLRTPLKILVFYSFARSNPDWLQTKLNELRQIKNRSDRVNGIDEAEYLIIIGDYGSMESGLFSRELLA